MDQIKIYKYEASAGLTDVIMASAQISLGATLLTTEQIDKMAKADNLFPTGSYESQRMENTTPKDCMALNCVLVSTNWNKNDDIFTPDQTWAAAYTPVLKPANIDHMGTEKTENKIIGVISNSFPATADFKYPSSGGSPEYPNVPSDFENIICTCILWEKYFPTAVSGVKAGIEAGTQFVSMECIFSDFGYGLREEGSNEISLLPRNDLTSWLTASLRAYKGTGKVNINNKNYQVGRWLRNFEFSGVGIVKQPANPDSIIFDDYVSKASEKMKIKVINEAEIAGWSISNKKFKESEDNSVFIISKGTLQLWPQS